MGRGRSCGRRPRGGSELGAAKSTPEALGESSPGTGIRAFGPYPPPRLLGTTLVRSSVTTQASRGAGEEVGPLSLWFRLPAPQNPLERSDPAPSSRPGQCWQFEPDARADGRLVACSQPAIVRGVLRTAAGWRVPVESCKRHAGGLEDVRPIGMSTQEN